MSKLMGLHTRAATAMLGGVMESDAPRDYIEGIRDILAHVEAESAVAERARVVDEIRKRVNADGPMHFRPWVRSRIATILDEVAESEGPE